jgi:transposase-like protein
MKNIYKRHRLPPSIIQYAVWLYYRFNLSIRDVENLLAKHNISVSYEAIRFWVNKFVLQDFYDYLKCRRFKHGFVRVKCNGCWSFGTQRDAMSSLVIGALTSTDPVSPKNLTLSDPSIV